MPTEEAARRAQRMIGARLGSPPHPPGPWPHPTHETWNKAESLVEYVLETEGWTPEAWDSFMETMKYTYREWAEARERELIEEAIQEKRQREVQRGVQTLRALSKGGRFRS